MKLCSSLTLLQLPPPAVLARLAEYYTLHLMLPSAMSDRVLPPEYINAIKDSEFDTRRIVYHSTDEGKIHLARVLGGTLVDVSASIRKYDEQLFEPRLVAASSAQIALARDVATFVQGVVIVCSVLEKSTLLVGMVESRTLKFADSWDGLLSVLAIQ